MSADARLRRVLLVLGVVAVLFGLATLKEGSAVLFVDGEARRAAGHVVPFVLWFNVLAASAYVAAGAGLALGRRWAARLSVAIAGSTAVVFARLGAYIAAGGAFEKRTVAAMTLRTAFWSFVSWRACSALGCRRRA